MKNILWTLNIHCCYFILSSLLVLLSRKSFSRYCLLGITPSYFFALTTLPNKKFIETAARMTQPYYWLMQQQLASHSASQNFTQSRWVYWKDASTFDFESKKYTHDAWNIDERSHIWCGTRDESTVKSNLVSVQLIKFSCWRLKIGFQLINLIT